MPLSHAALRAAQKNFPTPRKREEMVARLRENHEKLDIIQRNADVARQTEQERIEDEMGQNLEECVYSLRQEGHISGGPRHVSISLPQ